mgnify:CR=1 FL=1
MDSDLARETLVFTQLLSIPLNGFYHCEQHYQGVEGPHELSIPLNGFRHGAFDLSGNDVEAAFNSIKWIPQNTLFFRLQTA